MANILQNNKLLLTPNIKAYAAAWQLIVDDEKLSDLSKLIIPTTISVKVANKAELFKCLEELSPLAEQYHIGTVNDRFIATVALIKPLHGMYIIKILERRKNSSDKLGLDSIDYLVSNTLPIYNLLAGKGLKVESQSNDMHDWISLRFGNDNQYEAKFTDHLVLHVGIKELKIKEKELLAKLDFIKN